MDQTRCFLLLLIALSICSSLNCFRIVQQQQRVCERRRIHDVQRATSSDYANNDSNNNEWDVSCLISRRNILRISTLFGVVNIVQQHPQPSNAAAAAGTSTTLRESLDELLYRIIRVREATVMETRLIKSGTFKDVQRANIKLAIRFMVDNYRLSDAFVSASTYLDGTNRRLEATQLGQSATQNLITILEYFDSSDVENLKVGQTSLSGDKLDIVLKGLDATRKNIDDFLSFFPSSDVSTVVARVNDENDANVKEFDTSLGPLLNMPKAV